MREFKAKIAHIFGGKNQQAIGKNGLRMHHLHPIFNNFLGETPPPPLLQEDKKNPLSGFIWSFTAQVKILPYHVYPISELWRQKLHTIFWIKIDTNSAKKGLTMHHLRPFPKIFSGRSRPHPTPLLREDKKFSSLALYDPLQLRWKFSRITNIEHRSFEGKNYTIFWEKSIRTRQNIGSECTICIHFSKIFPGEPPGPPPAGGGIPLPHHPLRADLVTPLPAVDSLDPPLLSCWKKYHQQFSFFFLASILSSLLWKLLSKERQDINLTFESSKLAKLRQRDF